MTAKTFGALFEDASQRDAYHVEEVVLQFTSDLHQLMKSRGLNKAELARILGKSPAYMTKVFRGDANFTVESMIRLSRAVGGCLHLGLTPDPAIDGFSPSPPTSADADGTFAREVPSAYRTRAAKAPLSISNRSRARSAGFSKR